MRKVLAALLWFAVAANAQEGFPLDGTWRATLPAAVNSPTTIVLIMQWDGSRVTGTINPGPEGVDFSEARLNPEGWKVSVAAKDPKGAAIQFEGVLSDLGKYSRVITGQWTQGGKSQEIRFVRE
jgi:hypothetical protein